MIVRVVNPPNGKTYIHNGYFKVRVYEGQETELPDVLLRYDSKTGTFTEHKQKVPKWAEFVRESPDGEWKQKIGEYPLEVQEKPKAMRYAGETAKVVTPKGSTKGGVGKRPSDMTVG